MLALKLQLVDTVPDINSKILNAFRLKLNSVLKRAAPSIKRRIGDVCEQLIQRTGEYNSLLSGDLLGELGVPDIGRRLDEILDTIKNSCDVQFTPLMQVGGVLNGGLTIGMVRSDFLDILGLPEAAYVTSRGTDIPWLNWILTQGDRIIIMGYDVKIPLTTAAEKSKSRTGLALMTPGTGWRVPPAFSGTLSDNFITRAFIGSNVESLLLTIVEQEIVNRL